MNSKKLFLYFCFVFVVVLFLHFCHHLYQHGGRSSLYLNEVFVGKYFTRNDKLTTLINAIPFQCSENVTLVVIVLCGMQNYSQRQSIRNTWGQWLSSKYSHNIPPSIKSINYHSNQAKLLFAIGSQTTKVDDIQDELMFLRNESKYDDIMYFPGLFDSYMNLTLKTLTGLNTARKTCSNAIYFLKADTDVFLNVPALLNLCQQHLSESREKPLIIGNAQFNAPVIRDKSAKWYVPQEIYPKPYFPSYVTGCGYLLNSMAVDNIIFTATKEKQLFYWEDVAVTGMYSANATIIDNKLFRYEEFMKSIESCHMRMIVLAHRISPTKMISLWNDITSGTDSCVNVPNFSNAMKQIEYIIKSMFFE